MVPEPATDAGTMQLDTFTAVESVTGDHINGVLFDNQGLYTVGSIVTAPGTDNMGGHWTYTVNSIAAADSAHQAASYNGFVYDLTYFDADTGTSYTTFYGTAGLTTGVARPHRQLLGQPVGSAPTAISSRSTAASPPSPAASMCCRMPVIGR